MDSKQQQNQRLLTSVDEESECSETVFLSGKEKYGEDSVGTLRKRKFFRWIPWALHITVFLAYAVFFSTKILSKSESKEWPGICS
jgi:hypothetical protein